MTIFPAIPTLCRKLWRSCQGVAALEFAFAAPVLILAVAAIVELAMVMFVSTLMEGGLREASRFGITGRTPAGVSREAAILDIVGDQTIGLVDMATAEITTKVYRAFGDIGKPEPFTDSAPANGRYDPGEAFEDINGNGVWDADMGAAGLGGPGDVVVYSLSVDWPLLTPLLAPLVGQDGTLRLGASVAVRNEPYGAGAGGAP